MKKNRIIAIVLAVALVGSLAGVSAFAASGNTQSTPAADTAAQKEDAQKTARIFETACPDAEVAVLSGGQPVYYYIISME